MEAKAQFESLSLSFSSPTHLLLSKYLHDPLIIISIIESQCENYIEFQEHEVEKLFGNGPSKVISK